MALYHALQPLVLVLKHKVSICTGHTWLSHYFFLLGAPVSKENLQDLGEPFPGVGPLQVLTERDEVLPLSLELVGRVHFGRHPLH